jgi:hypothetical protein
MIDGVLLATCLAATGVPSVRTLPPAMLREVASEPDTSTRERAAEAFAAGEAAYGSEDWAAAVEHFEEAQELAPHPFTEYNLGLAQARAGRTLEAWRTFDHLARHADDAQHREEAREQLAELRRQVAMIRVEARGDVVACLDGGPLALGETAVVLPGTHRLRVGAGEQSLELEAGETRQVEVRSADVSPTRSRAVRPLLAVAIGAGVVALGTGVGTLATEDRGAEIGLAATAGTAAAVAVATTIAALVLHTRRPRTRSETPAPSCAE